MLFNLISFPFLTIGLSLLVVRLSLVSSLCLLVVTAAPTADLLGSGTCLHLGVLKNYTVTQYLIFFSPRPYVFYSTDNDGGAGHDGRIRI